MMWFFLSAYYDPGFEPRSTSLLEKSILEVRSQWPCNAACNTAIKYNLRVLYYDFFL